MGLEPEGVHAAMGITSDALHRIEVDAIIAEAIWVQRPATQPGMG